MLVRFSPLNHFKDDSTKGFAIPGGFVFDHGFVADQANLTDTDQLVAEVSQQFGKLDILFINAGVAFFAPIEAMTLPNSAAYAASKATLHALAKSAAVELAPRKIWVNAVNRLIRLFRSLIALSFRSLIAGTGSFPTLSLVLHPVKHPGDYN